MNNQFKDLIVYEIYPTSFYDSNDDGVGDLRGITEKLDYISNLGFNAIWFNPFYKSPFADGGYDIEDFFDIDPKFGTLEDYDEMVEECHKRGIKVILDLVAGHASVKNKEFIASGDPVENEYSDLFIWNNNVWEMPQGYRLISGVYQRNGAYMVNFFAHQPAFNYGFNKVEYPLWQLSYEDERTFQARNYILDVMRFWLGRGADGFRVDMADSLVKNDEDKKATIEVWHWLFERIRSEYPEAFFVSEWSYPERAFEAGFDADFVLDHWDNFYHRFIRSNDDTRGTSLFNGGGNVEYALKDMINRFKAAGKYHKSLGLISGNHDTPRIANYLDHDKLKLFYLMLFSLPGVPFVLYGDELEMKSSNIVSKDGGYQRTGTRIPMIWNDEILHGFTNNDYPYLPFYDENKISVEGALSDQDSLYHFIAKLIEIRKNVDDLKTEKMTIKEKDRLFTFTRGDYLLTVNLSDQERKFKGEAVIASAVITDSLPPFSGVLSRVKNK